jgi:hypothetical protein
LKGRIRDLRRKIGVFLAVALAVLLAAPALLPGEPLPKAVILLSLRIHPYEALADELRSRLSGFETKVESLDDNPLAAKALASQAPDLIFTVGQEALNSALPNRDDIPLVFTMVLTPPAVQDPAAAKLKGVAMIPSPRRQLALLYNVFNMRRTVLFYNPDNSEFLATLYHAGCPLGMACEEVPIRNEKELLGRLKKGLGGYDGIVLVPDPAILTEEGLKALVAHSYEERVPIAGFSPIYLNMGAAVTISLPEEEIARQAAAIARNGQDANGLVAGGIFYPDACEVRVSARAERRVRLQVNEAALKQCGGRREGTP